MKFKAYRLPHLTFAAELMFPDQHYTASIIVEICLFKFCFRMEIL